MSLEPESARRTFGIDCGNSIYYEGPDGVHILFARTVEDDGAKEIIEALRMRDSFCELRELVREALYYVDSFAIGFDNNEAERLASRIRELLGKFGKEDLNEP